MTDSAPLMVSSWWPRESKPHATPFIVDHAVAVERAVGAVECWSIEPGTRATKDAPHAGNLPVARRRIRLPWPIVSSAVGTWLMFWAGWLRGRFERFPPRVILVQSFEHAGPYAAGLARATGSHLVYLEHWSAVALGDLSHRQRRELRFVMRHADASLAVSRYLAHAMERLTGSPEGTVSVLDNIVDPAVFLPAPVLRHPGTLIAQVADFRPVKGHALLVEALTVLKPQLDELDLRFILVGDGPELHRIQGQVAAAGLSHRVDFTGSVARNQVAKIIAGADWTLLTSRSETASCAAMESLVVGRPVIAPRVGALPSLIPGHDAIFYERTPTGLASALRLASSERPTREWDAIAADAAARFSPDVLSARYAQLIDEGPGR